MHRVFVYGTLKKGFHNHFLIEQSILLSTEAATRDPYHLSIGNFCIPYLQEAPGHPILGELYLVDDNTLNKLDELEKVPSHYLRKLITLENENDPAWIYVKTKLDPELLQQPSRTHYSKEDHEKYIPQSER